MTKNNENPFKSPRPELIANCWNHISPIVYAQFGKYPTIPKQRSCLKKFINIFGYSTLSQLTNEELKNFAIFLAAIEKEVRVRKGLPFKTK